MEKISLNKTSIRNMEKENQEYLILKSIQDGQETIRQRDISKIANISLGMTNTIIKKLIEKGLLKAKHINSKNINYLLTTQGINTISKRSTDFLKRTIRNVVVYKDAIDKIVVNIKKENYDGILIEDENDFNFLFEYSCLKHGIKFNDLYVNNKKIDEEYIIKELVLRKME